ncbi:MAG: NAD-dependent protein deacylase [Clostridia bacterium]|nr:NAD-dependent protein deacylase [Clostridia bacterium]
MNEAIREKLIEMLRPARKMVFFGGAGVSTESGIPDFRSKDGLYSQKYDVPPEVMLSHSYFIRHPEGFFRFYRDKMNALWAKPNGAHQTLARWEADGRLAAVVTQNIDGLHQAARSRNVFELHGSTHRNYCMKCGKTYGPEAIFDSPEPVPHCTCGGIIRPDVVLYEEGLDDATVQGAIRAIMEADVMIVAGTSLTVYPAAGLLRYCGGNSLVLINRDETAMDDAASLCIREPVGQVLTEIRDLL